MATAAPTDGNLLAQLQFFSMCVYLVLDDKPDILMRAGRQGSWPMANGDTEECEPEWEDFAYAYIPEAEEAKAWGTMVNTWVAVGCLYAAISAVQIGLHAFCNTSLPTLRAFLGFPRGLGSENCLSGTIPTELGIAAGTGRLRAIDLEGNALSGSLPSELGLMTQLTV
eukprot:gene30766-38541_t